ncbi:MAG: tetratricopeptide repeat protein, partial [Cyanobacteriota bacterium]|nr:tetratricopeptide repeat protein [Cyanobacteriota bacterium]
MLRSRFLATHFFRLLFSRRSRRRWASLASQFALSLAIVAIAVPAIAQSPEPQPIARNAKFPSLAQSTPLQAGKQFYEAGQYAEAVNLWQQAERIYRDRAEPLNRAQALNYLSLAYQKLGQWSRARDAIATSLNVLETAARDNPRGTAILAQALNAQGNLQLATGQTEAALLTWKQAQSAYERARDPAGQLGSQISQAQALQALGQYRRAQTLLKKLVEQLHAQPDSPLKADGLRSLGTALQTTGDFEQSKAILEESWAISQHLGASGDTAQTLLSIGNIARELEQYDVAKAYYQQAAQQATTAIARVQARLNFLSLLVHIQEWQEARTLIPSLEADLATLAPSRSAIYAWVNL